MYPSWLMVEYASTRLMSLITNAADAAIRAVIAPTHATTSAAIGPARNNGWARATR